MSDSTLDKILLNQKKELWNLLKMFPLNFLGKKRSPIYEDMVYELMYNFQALDARMSIKIHFLNSHLDYFPENCGDYSKEQGERFHRNIRMMEEQY